jgi:hypothetical protein
MQLTYRGVKYDYNPPTLEVTESDIIGKYRGQPVHYSYVRHVPCPQVEAQLVYRGVAYQTNQQGQVESGPKTARKSIFEAFQGRLSAMTEGRRQLIREAAQVHHENIQRSLEHRIAVARSQGNSGLLQQLEDEMRQMA